MSKHVPPEFGITAFNCPFCGAYAAQQWNGVHFQFGPMPSVADLDHAEQWGLDEEATEYTPNSPPLTWYRTSHRFRASACTHCKMFALWEFSKLIFPDVNTAPHPHEDMPPDVLAEYKEAATIVSRSPRGAAALLRLGLQRLLPQVGATKRGIDDAIRELVQKGLPVEVQQACDSVRVMGNESVHPGELDLKDDVATAHTLFGILNFIVDDRISQPKKRAALYARIPEGKRKEIERKDGKTS